jgi:hypothetical protein
VGSLADWSFDAARAEIAFKSSGVRVFVYRPGDLEGNAIVKRGKPHAWVAEMIVETIRPRTTKATPTAAGRTRRQRNRANFRVDLDAIHRPSR